MAAGNAAVVFAAVQTCTGVISVPAVWNESQAGIRDVLCCRTYADTANLQQTAVNCSSVGSTAYLVTLNLWAGACLHVLTRAAGLIIQSWFLLLPHKHASSQTPHLLDTSL